MHPLTWHVAPPALPQDAIDPAYGGEELAALRKEVQRLGHAAGEGARAQEALVQDMERAVGKREVICTQVGWGWVERDHGPDRGLAHGMAGSRLLRHGGAPGAQNLW